MSQTPAVRRPYAFRVFDVSTLTLTEVTVLRDFVRRLMVEAMTVEGGPKTMEEAEQFTANAVTQAHVKSFARALLNGILAKSEQKR